MNWTTNMQRKNFLSCTESWCICLIAKFSPKDQINGDIAAVWVIGEWCYALEINVDKLLWISQTWLNSKLSFAAKTYISENGSKKIYTLPFQKYIHIDCHSKKFEFVVMYYSARVLLSRFSISIGTKILNNSNVRWQRLKWWIWMMIIISKIQHRNTECVWLSKIKTWFQKGELNVYHSPKRWTECHFQKRFLPVHMILGCILNFVNIQ